MQYSDNKVGRRFADIGVYFFVLPCVAVIFLYDGLFTLLRSAKGFLLKAGVPFFRFVIKLNSKLDAPIKSGFLYENEVKEYAMNSAAKQNLRPSRGPRDCRQTQAAMALKGKISDLTSQAGFQPYNLCPRTDGESEAAYAQRIGRYRLEQLADQLIKNDVIIEFLCSNTKKRLSDGLLTAAEAYRSNAHMVGLADGLCFNGEVLIEFMNKIFDTERLNSLVSAINRLQSVASSFRNKEKSGEDTKQMRDAVVNILDLAFANIETLVPYGISCLSNISDIVLQQIRYRKENNSTAQLQRGQWASLLEKLDVICKNIVSSIKSFRSAADGGRIYGEWFLGLVNVIDSVESFLQNFTDYIHPSSFIASNEGFLASNIVAKEAQNAFAALDAILPEVDGKKIALDRDGGIKRLIELILKTITSELPVVLEYLRSVLQERHANYLAINGVVEQKICPTVSVQDAEKIIALAEQRKDFVLSTLESAIVNANGCKKVFEQLKERRNASLMGMVRNTGNVKLNTTLQLIGKTAKICAKKVKLGYGHDFYETSSAIESNICSLKGAIQELEQTQELVRQLYGKVIEQCRSIHMMPFLPVMQEELCSLKEKIEGIVERRIVSRNNEFMKKFAGELSLSELRRYNDELSDRCKLFSDEMRDIITGPSSAVNDPEPQAASAANVRCNKSLGRREGF